MRCVLPSNKTLAVTLRWRACIVKLCVLARALTTTAIFPREINAAWPRRETFKCYLNAAEVKPDASCLKRLSFKGSRDVNVGAWWMRELATRLHHTHLTRPPSTPRFTRTLPSEPITA